MSTMVPPTSDWICQVQGALEHDDDDNHTPEFFIRKVPDIYMANSKHFEPMAWRFGLHNRRVLDIGGTESVKIRVAKKLGLTRTQWAEFCESVVPDPKSLQVMYYGVTDCSQPPYTLEEIRWLLTLDALFLVTFLKHTGDMTLHVEHDRYVPSFSDIFNDQDDMATVWFDLLLVENQVPFQLLKRVIEKLRDITVCDSEEMKLPEWDTRFWHRTMVCNYVVYSGGLDLRGNLSVGREHTYRIAEGISTNGVFNKLQHNMDAVHYVRCGSNDTKPAASIPYLHIPSATTLHNAGVTIHGKSVAFLGDIVFENGCLTIPFLHVDDTTEMYLRNLLVYESLYLEDDRAKTYTKIMDDLVKTEDDFKLLVDSGVVVNNLDDDELGAHKIWKRINYRIHLPLVSEELYTTLKTINKFVKSKRNLYWFEFKKTFCSRPWLVISVLTISVVTIATCIQTYTAVIGSNGS
jgi:hypothetical protein